VDHSRLHSLGVSSWAIAVDGHEPHIEAICKERDYKNRDFINVSKAGMGDVSAWGRCRSSVYDLALMLGARCTKRRSGDFSRSTMTCICETPLRGAL